MKKNIKYIVVVVLALFFIFLSTILLYHKPIMIEKWIKDVGLFLNHLVGNSKKVDNKVCDNVNEELENQISELKKILSIDNVLSEYENIYGVVISRDIGYWYDKVIINKGSNDGVMEGMAVINSEGLIGKVISSSNFNSTVQLLTSENINKTSVKIENNDNYVYGLITEYKEDKNSYIVEGISDDIKIGSKVTTTGFGDIFPAGIIVGTVIDSKSDAYGLAKTIEIKPNVDFNNINIVSILKRKIDA